MASRKDVSEEHREEHVEGGPNPVWFLPVLVSFLLIGLVWILVFYLSDQRFPIPGIAGWNLIVGIGIAFIGFLMTLRWR